jgi:hypothetical protein
LRQVPVAHHVIADVPMAHRFGGYHSDPSSRLTDHAMVINEFISTRPIAIMSASAASIF